MGDGKETNVAEGLMGFFDLLFNFDYQDKKKSVVGDSLLTPAPVRRLPPETESRGAEKLLAGATQNKSR